VEARQRDVADAPHTTAPATTSRGGRARPDLDGSRSLRPRSPRRSPRRARPGQRRGSRSTPTWSTAIDRPHPASVTLVPLDSPGRWRTRRLTSPPHAERFASTPGRRGRPGRPRPHFITLNEPGARAFLGDASGVHAPGRTEDGAALTRCTPQLAHGWPRPRSGPRPTTKVAIRSTAWVSRRATLDADAARRSRAAEPVFSTGLCTGATRRTCSTTPRRHRLVVRAHRRPGGHRAPPWSAHGLTTITIVAARTR
jgi:hypothetical protein